MNKYIYLSLLIIVIIIGGIFLFSDSSEENMNNNNLSNVDSVSESDIDTKMIAVIQTNLGNIKIEFFNDKTPKTVENFLKLAQGGFYDGTKFHRVISGFMIQGGDPLTKDETQKELWGTGGPGYTFADEIHEGNSNSFGTISMANAGPNTNGSQFFINTSDNNFLDSKHTVFGRVIDGIEIVRGIETTPTDGSDRPVENVTIRSVMVE